MPKPANQETVEMQASRKLIKVKTVQVPVMVSSKDLREKYKYKNG